MSQSKHTDIISMEINGNDFEHSVEHRHSLADFLRETVGLTGTHLGCEQGVCGACTVEIDGAPSRSCITLAHACAGAKIRTIEGYNDDPVMQSLREAFSEFHGLQCGFCTPGFLIACREIVTRNLATDDSSIRLALGGNLCRCTGYVGIVSAVKAVLSKRDELVGQLDEEIVPVVSIESRASAGDFSCFTRSTGKLEESKPASPAPANAEGDQTVHERFRFDHSADAVWEILADVDTMVACVPGAQILERDGDKFQLEMQSSFGAISAKFMGEGNFSINDSQRRGKFEGAGSDARSGSGASGALDYYVSSGDSECWLELTASYDVTGPLAQFSRGGLVKSFAGAVIGMFAKNIEKILDGEDISSDQAAGLSIASLIWSVVKQWFSKLSR